ncbi:MAG: DUF6285 domain-containing protein [Acidimicrobiia bacterium]
MQPRPTAAELLACVTEVLEREIVPALDGPAQHHARVAASLVAIVERELRLAAAGAERERAAIAPLVDGEHTDLVELRAALVAALRAGAADDDERSAEVWAALMQVARDDLAISKPGHDDWTGD